MAESDETATKPVPEIDLSEHVSTIMYATANLRRQLVEASMTGPLKEDACMELASIAGLCSDQCIRMNQALHGNKDILV